MIRTGEISSTVLRLAGIAAVALMLATPRVAAAQATAAAPAPEDILKFSSTTPHLILFQIAADKTADFESGFASMKEAFGKATEADVKAFGETLGKLFKLDQPPIDTPAGKAVVYVLQLDSPSTAYSYNPISIIYDVLWKKGAEGAPLKREEADAIYKKFENKVFLGINPWKLSKVG